MMLIDMMTHLALLWGLFFVFIVKSTTATTPETHTDHTTRPPTTVHELNNEEATQAATLAPTHKAAEVSITATAGTEVSPRGETEKNEEANVNTRSNSLSGSTVGLGVSITATIEATDRLRLLHTSTPATTADDGGLNATIREEATQTRHLHQQSTTTFSNVTTPAATLAELSSQSTSVTELENTSELSSIISLIFNSTATPTNPTSEVAPVSKTTSSPISTELPSSSQADRATSNPRSTSRSPETTGSSTASTSISTDSHTSTSASGILIPREPKKLPPTKPDHTTTKASQEVSQKPSGTDEVQPCFTRGLVKQCLIIIACLATLATIFIISTIALCIRLSSRKYKVKRPQQGTEMMCISSLLPEKNYTYTRQRNPVSNGVLVFPGVGDSDDDVGDNLTLSSFLPENDRFV